MRAPFRALCLVAACTAALESSPARPADVQAAMSVPRVSFDSAGPELTRSVSLALDGERWSAELRTPYCAASSTAGSYPVGSAGPCFAQAPGAQVWQGMHDASLTFKMPQWTARGPYLDLSLRHWNDARTSDDRVAARGSSAEAELTQEIGPYEIFGGYAHPLAVANAGAWRTVWAGMSARVAPRTRARLLVESSREIRTEATDVRYALQLGRVVNADLRFTASLSRAATDPDRRWRAGFGLEWSF